MLSGFILKTMKDDLDQKGSVFTQCWTELSEIMSNYQAEVQARVDFALQNTAKTSPNSQVSLQIELFNMNRKLKLCKSELKNLRSALAHAEQQIQSNKSDVQQIWSENTYLKERLWAALKILEERGEDVGEILGKDTEGSGQIIFVRDAQAQDNQDDAVLSDMKDKDPSQQVVMEAEEISTNEENIAFVLQTNDAEVRNPFNR